ncbi:type II secretion system F family protein [Pontiellaceae bacterium B12219]|nr:type II secretion system F family protein [Pontiellaceae bacterium B12219]
MFWLVPSLFALCAMLMGYVVLRALREAEESYASEYTSDTARQFEDLFLFISPKQMLNISRLIAVIVFFLLFFSAGSFDSPITMLSGALVGGIGGMLALFFPRLILKVLRIRRLERFNSQLVNALTGMSNALKAGFSIQQAIEAIVMERENPISQEFGMFQQQIRVGMTFEDAMADMDRRVGSEDLTLMIQSVEIARQTGGNLTEVFDRIAETIRERRRIEGKIKSMTAQGKIQGNVVGAMPFVLGFAIYLLDPGMMTAFFQSYIGMIIIGMVIVMVALGMVVIRKIVNIDV